MVQLLTVSVPELTMPPNPLVMVRALIVTVSPPLIVKMRLLPPALRRTVNSAAPGPLMVTLAARSGKALPRLIVPVTLKLMVVPQPSALLS